MTTTVRVNGNIQDHIAGADPWIVAKIQAADPNLYGGKRIELFGGASLDGKLLGVPGLTLLAEAGIPVYQNLNGPQIAKNWQATMGLRWKATDASATPVAAGLPTLKGIVEPSAPLEPMWNGLYLGLNSGYAWNADDGTRFDYVGSGGGYVALAARGALPSGLKLSNSGFIGGGQIGYEWLLSDKFLAGVETDVQGLAVGVSEANWFAASPPTYVQGVRSQHNLGTARGRAGWLVTPTILVYGMAGLAFGEGGFERRLVQPELGAQAQRRRQRLRLSRHAHRMDRRRRRRVDVSAEMERQGRVSLLRSRNRNDAAAPGCLRVEGALLQCLIPGALRRPCHPRWRELSLRLGCLCACLRLVLIHG